jgi:hypothetical protein
VRLAHGRRRPVQVGPVDASGPISSIPVQVLVRAGNMGSQTYPTPRSNVRLAARQFVGGYFDGSRLLPGRRFGNAGQSGLPESLSPV